MHDATSALETPSAPLTDPALLAAAGFLAGYSGTTRAGYTIDRHAAYTVAAFVAGATNGR